MHPRQDKRLVDLYRRNKQDTSGAEQPSKKNMLKYNIK